MQLSDVRLSNLIRLGNAYGTLNPYNIPPGSFIKVAARHISFLLVKGLVAIAKIGFAAGLAIWNVNWSGLLPAFRFISTFLLQVALIPVYRDFCLSKPPSKYHELAVCLAAAILSTAYLRQTPSSPLTNSAPMAPESTTGRQTGDQDAISPAYGAVFYLIFIGVITATLSVIKFIVAICMVSNFLPRCSLHWSWRGKTARSWLRWSYNFVEAVVLALLATYTTVIQFLKFSGLQSKHPP